MLLVEALTHGEYYTDVIENFPDINDELWKERFIRLMEVPMEVRMILYGKRIRCFYVIYGRERERGVIRACCHLVGKKKKVVKKKKEQGDNHIFTPPPKKNKNFSFSYYRLSPRTS